MEEKVRKIALHYGRENQSKILIEEMAELTKAIIKLDRANTIADYKESFNNLIEELADVEIMLEQVKFLYGTEDVNSKKEEKVKRQIERMKNNE